MSPIALDGRGRYEPERTSRGYRIENPDGKVRTYARATTVAQVLEDAYKLDRWHSMKTAHGLGQRPDLVALAAGHDIDADRSVYEELIDDAQAVSDVSSKANIGTALHRFAEQIDAGKPLADLPPEWHRHLDAYQARMEQIGFEIVHEHTEQVVALDDDQIAGQIDRVLRATRDVEVRLPTRTIVIPAEAFIIGDLKTGASLHFSRLKFTTQITIYANHDITWHPDSEQKNGGTRGPRIDVDYGVAMIIHLPAGDPTAPCRIHWVDLEAGYTALMCALQVRKLRSEASQMIGDPAEEHVTFEEATGEWLRGRLAAFEASPAASADLRRQWPLRDDTGHPVRLPKIPTAEQAAALTEVLSRVEAEHQMPFGAGPPEREKQPSFIEQLEHS